MNPHKHRLYFRLIRSIILFLIVIGILTTVLAGVSIARPIQINRPFPYVMSRGDGDTINGKYFIHDPINNVNQIFPQGPLPGESGIKDLRDKHSDKQLFQIKWMILYRLIK